MYVSYEWSSDYTVAQRLSVVANKNKYNLDQFIQLSHWHSL